VGKGIFGMRRTPVVTNKKALTIAVIIAILFGIIFVRPFFTALVLAVITAYLFNPLYNWFARRVKRRSTASSLTLIVAILVMLIPVIIVVIFTLIQINHLIDYLDNTSTEISLNELGLHILDGINRVLARIPGAHPITIDQFNEAMKKIITSLASLVANIIVSSVSSISSMITSLFIYFYAFLALLTNKDYLVNMVKQLNPLGPAMTDRYLDKAGAMTGAMARGQFVIAICQGFVEAIILTIAGIHNLFFFLFVLLSVLSIVPLGGGIIAIPIGIIMLLTGHIWQGLLVLVGHFAIITNIDNVLRPRLVPKRIRLNPALTLLAVFSGVAMFGFLGIVIGPVLMIIIKLTIEAYIEANSSPKETA
jgi:predicted PurR-regulated permease PerM